MGNTVGAPVVSDYLEDEIGPIVSQYSMGNSRFLKTLKAIHDLEGHVIVKIYKKRNTKESLIKYGELLEEIKGSFEHPTLLNLMPYQNFIETERSGYLIRQYFSNNLYDRLSTRPFLSTIEKKFISYQLLSALVQSSFKGVSHGDIKCENVMVTTTNWIYLADFACYKPTFIPEDNPADFSFYFDTSGRRTCYIAPERFYETNKGAPKGELTPEMDIFSMGCVIGELFTDGTPLFDFSQMLSYRKGEYNPEPLIRKIGDIHIQSLILHMLQREHKLRFTPEKYIRDWTGKAFPHYFPFVHQFIPTLMKLDHDDRIQCIIDKFDEIINIFQKQPNSQSSSPSTSTPPPLSHQHHQHAPLQSSTSTSFNNQYSQGYPTQDNIKNILLETERFIQDCDKMNLEKNNNQNNNNNSIDKQQQQQNQSTTIKKDEVDEVMKRIKSTKSMRNIQTPEQLIEQQQQQYPIIEGLDLLLSIIYSSLRHCQYPQTKVKCVGSLFVKFAQHLNDECRLQKLVPYIISMISPDQPTLVRVEGLRSLSKVLEMVETFPASDSMIFSQYILPSLLQVSEGEEIVRIAFAEILPQLATTAKRFLEIAQDQHSRDSEERKDMQKYKVYDAELSELQDIFYQKVSDLLTKDSCNTVKRVILSDIYRLCLFFGRAKTNDSVLPLITTFLNDKDWQLRSAFFENIVAVCTVVGAGSLESFIYPMTLEALTDEEEFVTERAISSLCELTELGLFRKAILLELLVKASPLLLHPNNWIRYSVISLITNIAARLSKTDIYCYVKPRISQYLIADISDNISESNLLQLLIPPISRDSFNTIVNPLNRHHFPHSTFSRESLQNSGSYRRLKDISNQLFNQQQQSSIPQQQQQHSQEQENSTLEELPEDFMFLKQLGIPPVDQFKIIKVFDYIRSKKIFSKMEDTGDNYRALQAADAKDANLGNKVKIAKLRNDAIQLSSSTPLSPTPGAMSVSSSMPISPIPSPSTASGVMSSSVPPTSTPPGSTPTSSLVSTSVGVPGIVGVPNNNQVVIGVAGTPSSGILASQLQQQQQIQLQQQQQLQSSTTPLLDQTVGQQELSIINKKFMLSTKEPVLTVEVTQDCYLRPPPPAPDLGGNSEFGVTGVSGALAQWKPAGILVSHFIEHKDAVNEIQVSADNLFFATASNDGTVKIWDCLRMEKGVTNRARQTYTQDGRITSISICEKSYTIASASDKGSIHIFRVGIQGRQKNGNIKYSGLSTVKNITDCQGTIVSVDHYNTNSSSIVTYATSKGGIHGWDLRSQQEAFHLNNEMSLGLIQAFLIDPARNWLITATSRGFLTCWDLRFNIPLYSERVTNGRIFKMSPYHGSKFSSESWIFLASDSKDNVLVWDLASKSITKIFKRSFVEQQQQQQQDGYQQPQTPITSGGSTPSTSTLPNQPGFASTSLSSLTGGIINQMSQFISPLASSGIFGSSIGNPMSSSVSTLSEYDFGIDSIKPSPTISSPSNNRLLNSGIGTPPSTPQLSQSQPIQPPISSQPPTTTSQQPEKKSPSVRALLSPPQCSYLLTAGDDRRIKYWDWDNPTQSYYVSQGKEPPLPHINKVSFKANGTQIQEELWSMDINNNNNSATSSTQSPVNSSSTSRPKQKTPTTPTIHHQETILDLKIMEVPQPMLISCSADGVVKVWK